MVRALGTLFKNRSLGLASGLIYALNPDAAFYSTQLFAESISVWLLLGSLYGLASTSSPIQPGTLRRFACGVLCGSLLILCKPVWQYFWMATLAFMAVQAFRVPNRLMRAALAVGCLVMTIPGAYWVKRNHDAWGVTSLSFSKDFAKRTIAEGVVSWAGASERVPIPEFTRELQLHCLVPDFSQHDFLPVSFKEVTNWNRQGVAEDYRVADELHSTVLRDFRSAYMKLHLLSSAYTLMSPATNFVKHFLGFTGTDFTSFANFGTSGIDTKSKLLVFLQRSLSDPFSLIWSAIVVSFLATYYAAVICGIRTYVTHYFWNIWTLYIVCGGGLIFLLGPAGTSRYRFALLQAFLPLAALGSLRWRRRMHPETASDNL
jgi:hypothetical protein